MRILQIIQKLQLRGAEIFTCQLSTELIRQKFEVDVLYLFDNEKNDALDFDLKFIPLNANPARRLRDFKTYRKLSQIIDEGRYDIVQANSGDTLKYAVLSKLIYRWRAKLVFRNANRMTSFIHSPFQRIFNKWLLNKCDYFISVSENSRQDLIKLYPPAAFNSVTIPQATYTFDAIAPMKRSIPAHEPVLIGVGSFVPEKNHIFLLEIFYHYYKLNGKGFLWLVGDGKLNSLLKAKVEELGIKERVTFWGYQRNVIPFLKSADVFVIPSLIEGLPAAILEAISCEIPVVASAVGGIPEVIENEISGICIQEWSINKYVESIDKLLSNEPYKKGLVRQAKAKLLQRFIVDKVAVDFGVQYGKLMSGHGL
jgi:glycosyltransferase involved in cell wall biosynthesis